MKKLHNIFKIALAAVLVVGFASCEETAPEYEAGTQDVEGCYGVYFPTQAAAGDHTLDPTAPKSIDIVVMRQNPEDSITVPVNIIASTDSIFEVPAIVFEDGQLEDTITITFPDVETAVKYSLTLEITDSQYASLYGNKPVSFSLSIFCVEWKWIGVDADGNQTAVATEEEAATVNFTEGFWLEGETLEDVKIKFYEVNGVRNCVAYHEDGIWPEAAPVEFNFSMKTKANEEGKYEIDVKRQYMGWEYEPGYPVYFYDWYSYWTTDGYNPANPTWADADDFYTKHGGSYPRCYYDGVGGYYFNLKYYIPGLGGWDAPVYDLVAIVNGVLRQDFTTIASVGETINGIVPVTIAMGKDVANVKYTVLEGEVTNKVAKAYCDSIIADTLDIYPVVTPEEATFGLEFETSGVYTLVVVPFDAEGVAQQPAKDVNFLAIPFTYVAADEVEKYATDITLGVEPTSGIHAKDGNTDVNSFQYYLYGQNIAEVRMTILETEKYSTAPDAYNAAIAAEEELALSDSIVALINAGGMSDLVVGLKPLTSYTVVAWVSNGYSSTFATAEYTTSGLPLELLGTGTYTYTCMFTSPVADPGYKFYKDPNFKDTYKITNWFEGVDFTFTCTSDTVIYVPNQYSGYTDPQYGPVYVMGLDEYAGEEKAPHAYDAESKTFYFGLIYYVSAGYFGLGYETFTLDESGEATARARRTISSSLKTSEWGVKEFKPVGPQLAGKVTERNMANKAEFTVKEAKFSSKSMKPSNKKMEVIY